MSGTLTVADYVRIQSSEGSEFVVQGKIVPKGFPTTLAYPPAIVETIIQYLYYKNLNGKKNIHKIPPFDINPSIALQLLKAATDLGI